MIPMLDRLKDRIDIREVPFSLPGSRLTLYGYPQQSSIYLRLAERLVNFFPGIESYTNRPPFLEEMTFLDGDQNPLDFQVTTHPHVLEFLTRLGIFRLLFRDEQTLCIQVPSAVQAGIRLRMQSQGWQSDQTGGWITSYRNLQYATNGKVFTNQLTTGKENLTLAFILESSPDCSILLSIGEERKDSFDFSTHQASLNAARATWQAWFDQVPQVAEKYQPTYAYAWWVLLNNMLSPRGNIKYTVLAPSKKNYVGIWLWDNALHAVALRHLDPQLARDQIRAFLALQQADGMLPDAIFDDGIVIELDHPVRARVTKPPVLAWAALKIHAVDPDLEFFKEIYEPLVRWNRWWFRENDTDRDGYIQYNHPFSSGLDDNPTWDYGMPVESPDINTYLYIQMQALAHMAGALGKKEESESWLARSELLLDTMIQNAWDEERGYFEAIHEHNPIPILTPLNLFPLWTADLPESIKRRLLAHLTNPQEFYGDLMLPTVARCDPAFDADRMWRGPLWANINYFFIEALLKNGEIDLARDLRDQTLALIMRNPGIYEYYHAVTGKPGTNSASAYGWTAAVFIDLAIQASKEIQVPS
jgi:glycogen debranching enzyme